MTWEILRNLSPWLLILAGLLWGAWELRVRKLLEIHFKQMDEKIERSKEELREELNPIVMRAGTDAMRALEKAHDHDKQLTELGVKADFYWDDLARGAARLLREHRRGGQDDDSGR